MDITAAAGIDARVQATLLQLRFHLIGIERRDAERDVADRRATRRWRRSRRRTAIAAAAAANDDVADVADLALVLAAFVGSGLPSEQRHVEGGRLLVVRHLERDVIEPDRLPLRRRERRRCRGLAVRRSLPPVLPAAIADLEVETAGIFHVEALEVTVIIRDRIETALAELGLHLLCVPRLDPPAEAVERRVARRARPAALAAATAIAASRRSRLGLRRCRRRLIATANHEAAPVADVEHRLLAVVAPDLPVHERGVVGRLLRVVDGLTREMVEQHRLPSGRLEWQLRGSRIALGRAGAGAAALTLRERRRRAEGDGSAQSLQQTAARDSAAIEVGEQLAKVDAHEGSCEIGNEMDLRVCDRLRMLGKLTRLAGDATHHVGRASEPSTRPVRLRLS